MARPGRYGELLLLDTTVYEGPVVPFGRPSDVVDLQGKNFKAIVKTLERVRKNTDLLDNILANLIPKGETQREIGGPLIFPYATTPANWASGQVYWNSASDVMFYNHLGTAKRVGTPVPIWKQYSGAALTFAIPTVGWVEVSSALRITITPAQKVVVVAGCQLNVKSDIAAGAGLDMDILPAPADIKYVVDTGGASGTSEFTFAKTIATLTANTAYTITPKVNQGGGPGTITVSGASGETLSWATFHHPA